MSIQPKEKAACAIALPDVPVVCAGAGKAAIMTTDGEIKILPEAQARLYLHKKPAMACHAPYTRHRLGLEEAQAFDVLELFAFVHPAIFCVPTPAGLAKALSLSLPQEFEDYPYTILEAARVLLSDLAKEPRSDRKADPLEIAKAMGRGGYGWPWTPFVCEALGERYEPAQPVITKTALNVWKRMPEWSEQAPPPPPSHEPVSGEESLERLSLILGAGAEARSPQKHYASGMSAAFAPGAEAEKPHLVLAEAGTGVGKTLGYLAPASVWMEKNKGTVWISTYTKNLQRQIDRELDRVFPHPAMKEAKVAIRKGRENYLCLLNLEDMVTGAALAKDSKQAIAAGLMARWAEASRDGDLQGGDFPGWLAGLLGYRYTAGLSDRRGECIYAACDHYHRCFVERTVRKAQHAGIVVANHALVMSKAATARPDEAMPQRYIFDEGHHLFDAADSAFAGHLSARETHDLRRWIMGAEEGGGRQSRARGIKRRAEDLLEGDVEGLAELEAIRHEARALPALFWSKRLRDNTPEGAAEQFLMLVYRQVFARAEGREGPYSLEAHTHPLIDGLDAAASDLKTRLRALQKPMRALSARLRKKLADQADTLDTDTRKRLESVANSLDRRAEHMLAGWIAMLESLAQGEQDSDPAFVDWMEIERVEGKAVDVGLYRHWIDPMKPFSKAILPFAQGIAITSATLRDGTDDENENWRIARERTGADYLNQELFSFAEKSPFDYASQTRIFVINDINKNDMGQVAAAYRELFKASGGGALGLFTAIHRLKAVQERILQPLEESGITLYAQHMDEMDTGTLVDIFREEIHACLLGTDAVRDGVDVPGESLRLLIYDRVPWPRPTILHKARRDAFGGRRYDELITRLKLRQAYGRLIRRAADRGVFVMLDSGLPTRLCQAFPVEVEIRRVGLAEGIKEIRALFSEPAQR